MTSLSLTSEKPDVAVGTVEFVQSTFLPTIQINHRFRDAKCPPTDLRRL